MSSPTSRATRTRWSTFSSGPAPGRGRRPTRVASSATPTSTPVRSGRPRRSAATSWRRPTGSPGRAGDAAGGVVGDGGERAGPPHAGVGHPVVPCSRGVDPRHRSRRRCVVRRPASPDASRAAHRRLRDVQRAHDVPRLVLVPKDESRDLDVGEGPDPVEVRGPAAAVARHGCSAGRRGATCGPPRGSGRRRSRRARRRADLGPIPRLRRPARGVRVARRVPAPRCSPRRRPRLPRGPVPDRTGSTPPAYHWSRSTRRAPRTSTRPSASCAGGERVPGALRHRRRRRGRRTRRVRWTPRCAVADRRCTCPTGRCRCTRRCCPRTRASLLPDGPRAAVLWRIDLDGAGEIVAVDVRRAVVLAGTARLRGGPGRCRRRAECTPRSPRCPRSGRCAGHWPCAAGRSSWSFPSRRSCPPPTGGWTVQVRRRHRPSRSGTPRSRCSPACPRPG